MYVELKKSVERKDLASILGRVENVAQVLVMVGHFLSYNRYLGIFGAKKGHNIRLDQRVKDDLALAEQFLNEANRCVGMNLLT